MNPPTRIPGCLGGDLDQGDQSRPFEEEEVEEDSPPAALKNGPGITVEYMPTDRFLMNGNIPQDSGSTTGFLLNDPQHHLRSTQSSALHG